MCKLETVNNNIDIIHKLERICQGQKLSTVKRYRDIYLSVDAYILQGAKKSQAITWTSDDFKISERTVYDALVWFEG